MLGSLWKVLCMYVYVICVGFERCSLSCRLPDLVEGFVPVHVQRKKGET